MMSPWGVLCPCTPFGQDHLYENLELGVDLDSRIALVGACDVEPCPYQKEQWHCVIFWQDLCSLNMCLSRNAEDAQPKESLCWDLFQGQKISRQVWVTCVPYIAATEWKTIEKLEDASSWQQPVSKSYLGWLTAAQYFDENIHCLHSVSDGSLSSVQLVFLHKVTDLKYCIGRMLLSATRASARAKRCGKVDFAEAHAATDWTNCRGGSSASRLVHGLFWNEVWFTTVAQCHWTLMGILGPEVKRSGKLRIGHYNQHSEALVCSHPVMTSLTSSAFCI